MTSRHYRDRLILDLAGADKDTIAQSVYEWETAAGILEGVSKKIRDRGTKIDSEIEGQAGVAMVAKFIAISDKLMLDSEGMKKGSEALVIATNAARAAIATRDAVAAADANSQAPMKPEGPIAGTPATTEQTQALATYNSNFAAYEANEAAQEEKARVALQKLDTDYAEAAAMMKEIHGQPDPEDEAPKTPTQGPGGPGYPLANSPSVPGNDGPRGDGPDKGGTRPEAEIVRVPKQPEPVDSGPCFGPRPPQPPVTIGGPGPGDFVTPTHVTHGPVDVGGPTTNVVGQADSGSTYQSQTAPTPSASASSAGGGVAGGAAAGMASGSLGAGLMKGAGSSPSLKAASVRAIGVGGRAAAPGALSRSTTSPSAGRGATAGSSGSPSRSASGGRAAGAGAAAGSTSRTAGAGGRAGAAGSTSKGAAKGTGKSQGTPKGKGLFGRGAIGSTTGGRSGNKNNDETATSADSLVYEQEWLGDDSVAPSVLD